MMLAALGAFGDAIEFIFKERESQAGTVRVGGLGEIWDLTFTHLQLSIAATLIAVALATVLELAVLVTQRAFTPWERAVSR